MTLFLPIPPGFFANLLLPENVVQAILLMANPINMIYLFTVQIVTLAVSGIKWDCLMKTYPFAAKPCLKALSV